MSYYTRDQFMQAAYAQREQLGRVLAQAQEVRAKHVQARAPVAQSHTDAMNDLARGLLPELTAPHVSRVISLAGFSQWQGHDPVATVNASLRDLANQKTQIEMDPCYRDRELLRHPRTGSLPRSIAETTDMIAPWRDVLTKGEHPRLDRLIEQGYGTDAYKVGFWRFSYYEDRAAADSILSHFPGKTFPEAAAEVVRARETVATLEQELARLQGELAAGEALEQNHARIERQMAQLPTSTLLAAQRRVVEHVMTSPPATMNQLLARDPAVQNLYLRASGISHKLDYLDKIAEEHTTGLESKVRADMMKLDRDITKYSRPKNYNAMIPVDVFQRRFQDRTPRYEKHWARYDRAYRTVYVYDDYDRASLLEDFLWWDLMTRGRVNGRYIPEVSYWYDARPGYVYVDPPDDDDDDAASAAASMPGDADDASVVGDAS